MSQKQPSIVDSIQSEVSKEASPLFDFLVTNAKKLILAAIVIGIAAAAYGGYSLYQKNQYQNAHDELGLILLQDNPAAKLEKLEQFAQKAPEKMKTAVYLAIVQNAEQTGKYEEVANAWGEVSKVAQAPMNYMALLGQARAVAQTEKKEEALALFETLLTQVPVELRPLVNGYIADLAASMNNLDRAIKASDEIMADIKELNVSSTKAQYARISYMDTYYWSSKIKYYEQLKAGASQNAEPEPAQE